jgi:hypothetical protein
MNDDIERMLKHFMSVAEMARATGMSRSRFYQLIRCGVFPPPTYSVDTRQPMYLEDAQRAILTARRRNCGVNGEPILFRSRSSAPSPRRAARPSRPRVNREPLGRAGEILGAIQALGMPNVGSAEVSRSISTLYPNGTATIDESELIRAVFLHLRANQRRDNVAT